MFDERTKSTLHNRLLDNLIKLENSATLRDLQALALNAYSSLCELSPMRRTEVHKLPLNAFLSRLDTITGDCPPERTFNPDEMVWRTSRAQERCLQKMGRNCEIDDGKRRKGIHDWVRDSRANADKLPGWIVTKGKMNR
jgi:hypothetical protein